ncbi:uncharacterized protein SPPG_06132 [Spizellomyces punctatus DAOM BR117]|uniref:J domain-containing protein n=1 Tax=Spizellomyces punctatus (strain DAOM BR117) TaxID=645134 RepID=A0A0L0HCD2_SPIPD|nr:uncharacterized protein SPPG_06132 [Spizellomyces punctatus DAOM BR117]KNC98428.1 hypothetical protein SPPG_06132 [Spizellomyces punctatus DAOM BR117]|eukprot:XP_016606468.1 hypothetical protein SPPG_06132 [Spizellomyces punctatus DAOM BR117]
MYTIAQEAEINRILSSSAPQTILQVQRSSTKQTLKQTYRIKALLVHPDKCDHPRAEEAFVRLRTAFETISAGNGPWRSGDEEKTSGMGTQRERERQDSFEGQQTRSSSHLYSRPHLFQTSIRLKEAYLSAQQARNNLENAFETATERSYARAQSRSHQSDRTAYRSASAKLHKDLHSTKKSLDDTLDQFILEAGHLADQSASMPGFASLRSRSDEEMAFWREMDKSSLDELRAFREQVGENRAERDTMSEVRNREREVADERLRWRREAGLAGEKEERRRREKRKKRKEKEQIEKQQKEEAKRAESVEGITRDLSSSSI